MARVLAGAVLLALTLAWSQEDNSREGSCSTSPVVSVPSRPTVTSSTDTTACGVLEAEYGLERQFPGEGVHRDDLSGGLRLGLTHNLDFHWHSADFVHIMDQAGDRTGFADNWLGPRYRFSSQTRRRPSLGVSYSLKIPASSVGLGLSSGRVDHSLAFLASKDFRRLHFDFNAIELLAGRPGVAGFDHNTGLALSASLSLAHQLSLVLESYGYTQLNASGPAYASTMAGLAWEVRPRLYLDGGWDTGLSSDAPRGRAFLGVTCAIGNAYRWAGRIFRSGTTL